MTLASHLQPLLLPPQPPSSHRLQIRIAAIFTELSGIETTPSRVRSHQFLELGFDSLFLTQATQSLQQAPSPSS